MEFQVRCLALFFLSSVLGGLQWFWMGSLHKNIQVMLGFLKPTFMTLHISYYTLITFLLMLSVILASMMIILLSTLSMIRYLICDNWNLLLKLNLIYMDWDGKWLVDLIVEKTQLVSFDWSNNTEAIVWIWMALFYRKNNLLRC